MRGPLSCSDLQIGFVSVHFKFKESLHIFHHDLSAGITLKALYKLNTVEFLMLWQLLVYGSQEVVFCHRAIPSQLNCGDRNLTTFMLADANHSGSFNNR